MTSRFDLGEPVFDVVEPGSLVGWRVVEVPFGVSGEELLNPFDLMRRQVVRDNMDLLAARLLGDQIGKEGPQLLAGVRRGQNGRLHREKIGPKGLARRIYQKRKTEVRKGDFSLRKSAGARFYCRRQSINSLPY
jgi:hypothetical protein